MAKPSYLHTTIIKSIAPENHKPRITTVRSICLSSNKNYEKTAEAKALRILTDAHEEYNPGIKMTFKATTTTERVDIVTTSPNQP